jgi:exopolysaccharide biosynthesis operon protein EpsL
MLSSLSSTSARRKPISLLLSSPSLLVALAGASCLPAAAQISDTIHPYVSVGYSYDDNLLRLPEAAKTQYGSLGDHTRTALAGVQLEQTFGRQQVTADLSASRVTFDRFDQYNYNGKKGNVNWLWRLGNYLDGRIAASYDETLTPFSDFRTDERNLRKQRGYTADGGWRFHPSWRVRAAASRTEYDYELDAQKVLNRDVTATVAGLDYYSTTGSTIGLQARREKGDYTNPPVRGGIVFNQNYTQDELKLKVFWRIGEVSQLEFLGGRVKRKHELGILGDPGAGNGRVTFTWLPRSTLQLVAVARREFDAFEGAGVNYTLTKGGNVDVNWVPTAKIQVRGSVRQYKREFGSGNGTIVLPPNLNDDTKGASLGLTYSPRERIQLGVSVSHEKRTSDSSFSYSYRTRGAAVNATIQF